MIFLPDVNIWLALAFQQHEHHSIAMQWFENVAEEDCSFCRMTQQGFLRLATNPKAFRDATVSLVHAWRMYDDLLADPRVVFSEEPDDLEEFWRQYTRRRSFSPKIWNDAYLAAFNRAAGYELVTMDQGLKQYRGLKCTVLE